MKTNYPYRLDLAGGWLDQPVISGIYPGSVITLSIEPIVEYKERCGMATSTRKSIQDLYSLGLRKIDSIELSKLIFNYDNAPGAKNVSGAQDAIGLCMKGLTRHYYNGKYWPRTIEILQDETTLKWMEDHIFLKLLWPRPDELDVLAKTNIEENLIRQLSFTSDKCWDSILNMDLQSLADALTATFEIQKQIFPLMSNEKIESEIKNTDCLGCKLAGAGGGGYLIMINNNPCGDKIKIRI